MLAPTTQSASQAERASFALAAAERVFSPFIYDRPVRGDEFLDRTSELRMIFSNLHVGVSTTISGPPRIGKSSLLLQVADETIQRKYLGDRRDQFVFALLDLRFISIEDTPCIFWQEALAPLRAYRQDARIARLAEQTAAADYEPYLLERLFEHMGRQELRLVLLLDEFEWLVYHPNFTGPGFFAFLRHLATITGGLAIVPACQFTLSQLTQRASSFAGGEQWPFFNYTAQVHLPPFDEETVALLLDRGEFDAADRAFIRRLAGRHPFLLQSMADTLLETTAQERSPEGLRYVCAAERFYKRVACNFDELWYTFENRTRTALVILSLLELGTWAHGERFKPSIIEKSDHFGRELSRFARMGLAEQVTTEWSFNEQNGVMWRGSRWRVSMQAFLWWVWDVVIVQSRQVISYDQWLYHKWYRLLLTKAQWEGLVATVRNAPQWAKYRIRGHHRHKSPRRSMPDNSERSSSQA